MKILEHRKAIRSCSKYEFSTFDYTDTFINIQSLGTQPIINYFSISKVKYKNLNYFSQLLLLLSSDINLNLGPVHQGIRQYSDKWNVFNNRGLYFINLIINSYLSKIEELHLNAKSTNAAVMLPNLNLTLR